jgi:acyl carrier protein
VTIQLPDTMREPTADTEVIDRVRGFVRENFLYMQADWPLADDTPLLAAGVLDSIGVLELVEFLQREYGITIADDDMTEQNLGSLNGIAACVAVLRAARESGHALRLEA